MKHRKENKENDTEVMGLPITEAEGRTYQAIAAGESVQNGEHVGRLVALGLVEITKGGVVALDPRVAMQRLLASERASLLQTIERMNRISQLESLAAHFDPNRMYGGPASELFPSRTLMNVRIGEALESAASEFLSVQPTQPQQRDPVVHRLGVQRTKALLDKGVSARSLYTAEALAHGPTREYVAELLAAGAEVRVGTVLPPRMMVVDTRFLFIDNAVVPAERDAGWCVVDVASVAWARLVFDTAWAQCVPWGQALSQAQKAVTSDRQRAILREMEKGLLQAAVAVALDLSERTVNKELASLRDHLGLQSTYQLIAWWATSADRGLP
ncbi:LuxR C-terminal-related transcriptional regulator [Streptomyces sp. NPDC056160]|uniref:LuxR C-terminal-related transcriptional regulator n=1 Tax=Streptomyces sp. NPDC056160 TaxID=3345731 RepID=UPI0035DAFDAF